MPAVHDARALGALAIFRGLPVADLSRLNELLHRSHFPAGAALLTVEQPGEVAYVVLEGTLKVHVVQADGRDVILALLGPGELVGEISLVDRGGRAASVTTLEPATLLWLDRATFTACRRSLPVLTENLLVLLARRLRLANAQIQALASLDVGGRVARQVLALAEVYGEPQAAGGVRIPLRLTQSELADLVGATRARVNQVLVAFRRRGYLSSDDRHRITVHNATALASYAE